MKIPFQGMLVSLALLVIGYFALFDPEYNLNGKSNELSLMNIAVGFICFLSGILLLIYHLSKTRLRLVDESIIQVDSERHVRFSSQLQIFRWSIGSVTEEIDETLLNAIEDSEFCEDDNAFNKSFLELLSPTHDWENECEENGKIEEEFEKMFFSSKKLSKGNTLQVEEQTLKNQKLFQLDSACCETKSSATVVSEEVTTSTSYQYEISEGTTSKEKSQFNTASQSILEYLQDNKKMIQNEENSEVFHTPHKYQMKNQFNSEKLELKHGDDNVQHYETKEVLVISYEYQKLNELDSEKNKLVEKCHPVLENCKDNNINIKVIANEIISTSNAYLEKSQLLEEQNETNLHKNSQVFPENCETNSNSICKDQLYVKTVAPISSENEKLNDLTQTDGKLIFNESNYRKNLQYCNQNSVRNIVDQDADKMFFTPLKCAKENQQYEQSEMKLHESDQSISKYSEVQKEFKDTNEITVSTSIDSQNKCATSIDVNSDLAKEMFSASNECLMKKNVTSNEMFTEVNGKTSECGIESRFVSVTEEAIDKEMFFTPIPKSLTENKFIKNATKPHEVCKLVYEDNKINNNNKNGSTEVLSVFKDSKTEDETLRKENDTNVATFYFLNECQIESNVITDDMKPTETTRAASDYSLETKAFGRDRNNGEMVFSSNNDHTQNVTERKEMKPYEAAQIISKDGNENCNFNKDECTDLFSPFGEYQSVIISEEENADLKMNEIVSTLSEHEMEGNVTLGEMKFVEKAISGYCEESSEVIDEHEGVKRISFTSNKCTESLITSEKSGLNYFESDHSDLECFEEKSANAIDDAHSGMFSFSIVKKSTSSKEDPNFNEADQSISEHNKLTSSGSKRHDFFKEMIFTLNDYKNENRISSDENPRYFIKSAETDFENSKENYSNNCEDVKAEGILSSLSEYRDENELTLGKSEIISENCQETGGIINGDFKSEETLSTSSEYWKGNEFTSNVNIIDSKEVKRSDLAGSEETKEFLSIEDKVQINDFKQSIFKYETNIKKDASEEICISNESKNDNLGPVKESEMNFSNAKLNFEKIRENVKNDNCISSNDETSLISKDYKKDSYLTKEEIDYMKNKRPVSEYWKQLNETFVKDGSNKESPLISYSDRDSDTEKDRNKLESCQSVSNASVNVCPTNTTTKFREMFAALEKIDRSESSMTASNFENKSNKSENSGLVRQLIKQLGQQGLQS